jgi:hypothetical protein
MDGTARGDGRMRRTRCPQGVAAAVGGLACLVLALAPAGAQAGVGASAVPTSPANVTVGNAGVAGVIELRNTDTDANAGQTNIVCNFGDGAPCPAGDPGITLIPSCSRLGPFSSCTGAEPGVFRVSDVATGQAGTACAAMVFNVSLINPANGQVRFTPQGGAHVSLPGAGSVCRIGFTFSVLRSPAADQNAGVAGVQTVQVADNTQYSGGLTASARGSSVGTTVHKARPAIATTASGDVTVGGQITDTATVTGLVSPVGGTVDFLLYGPDDATCARAPVYQSLDRSLSATGTATAAPFTPPRPGVYRWRAIYGGDANNEAVSGPCNAVNEQVTVIGPPTITVQTTRRARCVETRFRMRVNVAAHGLQRVRVTLDGRTVARSTKPRFTVRVRTRKLPRGRHVLRVIAHGTGGRSVRTTTFRRCGAPLPPRFVG